MSSEDLKGQDNPNSRSTFFGPGDHILHLAFKSGCVHTINGLWSKTATSGNIDGISRIVTDFYLHLIGSAAQTHFRYDTGGGVAVLFFNDIQGLAWQNVKATPPWSVPSPPKDLRLCSLVFKNAAKITQMPAIYSKQGEYDVGLNHLQTQFELFRRADPTIARYGNFRFDYSGAVLDLSTLDSITLANVK